MVHLVHEHMIELRDSPTCGKGYYATEFIKRGTLVLVEHVFAGTSQDVVRYLHFDPEAWSSLHPQGADAATKTNKNVFVTEGECSIGLSTSFFNHDCSPNTTCLFINTDSHLFTRMFSAFYTLKNVQKDGQLFISYNPTAGHDSNHDFSCTCNYSLQERKKRHNIIGGVTIATHNHNIDQAAKVFDRYIGSQTEIETTLKHHLVRLGGIYVGDEMRVSADVFSNHTRESIISILGEAQTEYAYFRKNNPELKCKWVQFITMCSVYYQTN